MKISSIKIRSLKNNIKRFISPLIILSVITAISGCSGENASQVPKAEKERTEIEYWYAGGKTAVKVMADIIDSFNASQDEYVIKPVVKASYDETYQGLQAALAGNVSPDLVLLETEASHYLSGKGILENVGEQLKSTPSFSLDDYIDVFIDSCKGDRDELYMFPAYGTTQVFYYNREAFEKAGVTPESIKSWQDLADQKERFTSSGTEYVWEPMWGPDNLIDVAFSNGASMFSSDGKEVTIDSPEWIQVFEAFRKWIHEDKIMKIHSGGQGWEYWYKTMDDALSGTAAGYTGSSGDQADLDFTLVGALEQPGFGSNASSPTAEAKDFVIVKSSSEKEKTGAAAFIRYFTSPEQQAVWSMGTGYVPVCKNMDSVESYHNYVKEHPEITVPLQQSQHASVLPIDPTGGKIYDALKIAADQVELENIPAEEALSEAQKKAEEAMRELS